MAITKLRTRGITADAITTSEIAPNTVAAADIAPGTVTTAEIAPGTIAAADISPAVNLGVPAVTSDPPTPSLSTGDMWLRTDLKQLKSYLLGSAAWSGGTTIPYGATGWSSNGTGRSSAWAISGYGSHPRTGGDNGARGKDFIKFDGSSWSNGPDYPYYNSGTMAVGTQSAALGGGGHGNPAGPNTPVHPSYSATTVSYEFDGSAWGSSANLNFGASSMGQQHGHGTQTDALMTNGWTSPTGTSASQSYDGSSWSAGATAPTSAAFVCSAGPTNDYLVFSGSYGSASAEFNGTSYSAGGTLTSSRPECNRIGTAYGPGNTGVMAVGGDYPTLTNSCELYNGTSWSADIPLANSPFYGPSTGPGRGAGNTGAGDSAGGLVMGGATPPYPGSAIAEYDGAALAVLSQPAFS